MIRSSVPEGYNNRKIGTGKMTKNWIADAVSKGKGKFSAKAKKAGKSTAEYAEEKAGASGRLGKEARLAKTLMGLRKKK